MADPSYPVGYRRPPMHSRFKPGVCPNRTGRPKGAKNFSTALDRELQATVRVRENGRTRHRSRQELLAQQFLNNAFQNPRFMALLLNYLITHQRPGEGAVDGIFGSSQPQQVTDGILQRLRAALDPAPVPEPSPSADDIGSEKPEGFDQC
jgi:hypothetical protein